LASLRQSFLNGSLTRLIDPDAVLKGKILEFVAKGEFGVGSGRKPDGGYDRVWFEEPIGQDEVAFESGVFLLLKARAQGLKSVPGGLPQPGPEPGPRPGPERGPGPRPGPEPKPGETTRSFRIYGFVPPEIWNRLGTKVIPKLRSGSDVNIGVQFTVTVDAKTAKSFEAELKQIIEDLRLTDCISIEMLSEEKVPQD
jgi:hypothetical protein